MYNILTLFFSGLAVLLSAVALYSVSSDDKDFEGLRITAQIDARGQTAVSFPATYQNSPKSMIATGSVIVVSEPTDVPLNFRIPLSAVDESQSSEHKTITYEDVRPLVCQTFGRERDCNELQIVSLAVEAGFARGKKSAPIYGFDPIDLG